MRDVPLRITEARGEHDEGCEPQECALLDVVHGPGHADGAHPLAQDVAGPGELHVVQPRWRLTDDDVVLLLHHVKQGAVLAPREDGAADFPDGEGSGDLADAELEAFQP
ncbi:hypothetical protein PG984_002638 [Apiospora sp. TS-2023a]